MLDFCKIITIMFCSNIQPYIPINCAYVLSFTLYGSRARLHSGVVKAATSYALYGHIDVTAGDQVDAKTEDICVKMEHLLAAISEIEPNFGASEDEFSAIVRGT